MFNEATIHTRHPLYVVALLTAFMVGLAVFSSLWNASPASASHGSPGDAPGKVIGVVTSEDGTTTRTYSANVNGAYPVPTITSVTPGAAEGGPTLTGDTQYDVGVRALNGINPGSAWASGQGTPQMQQASTYSIDSTATANEGENAELTVTLSETAPTGGVPFNVATDFSGQTASSTDVGAVPATVTVASGQTVATLVIPLAKDPLDEPSESFEVSISTSAAGWTTDSDGDSVATVTITDNTPVVSFSSASYQVTEGDGAVEIDIRAVGAHPGFTLFATSTTGTADSADFTAGMWSLEFADGDDTAVLSIPIASDVVYDYAFERSEETFTVTLHAGGDYALGSPAETTVTIHDAGYCHTVATPPGKPSFNSVTPAETSITITWNAPSTVGSGLITDFIFHVFSMDGQYLFETGASGSASADHNYSKVIDGLTANTTYMVKMRARTILGCYSPFTDRTTVTTLQ